MNVENVYDYDEEYGLEEETTEFVKDTTRRKRIKNTRIKIKHRYDLYNNKFSLRKFDKDKIGRLSSHAHIPEYIHKEKTNARVKSGCKRNWKASDIRNMGDIADFEE